MSSKSKILEYTAYFEPLVEGGYEVFFPNFPEVITYGRTLAEARKMAKDALRCHLEGLAKEDKNWNFVQTAKRLLPRREKIGIMLNPA